MEIRLIKSSFYYEQKTKDKLCAFIQGAQQLSISYYCKKFENDFSTRQGRTYSVFFNSGSSANLALIQSLYNLGKIQKGDKIGFSSLTWATNVMPLIQLGFDPIPVDVELSTLNISLNTIKQALKDHNIKVFFITNLLGFCDNIDEIYQYCLDNDILLLEDNCESMGTEYKGRKLGNYSFASTFSTFVGHHMSTIEGGLVCTDDRELYMMLNMVRAHGWDRNLSPDMQLEIRTKNKVDQSFYSKYTFYTLGYNLRPNEITGFLGCEQLQYLDEIVSKRMVNFQRFADAVNANDDFFPISYTHIEKLSNFAVPVICKSNDILQKYIALFTDNGVEIRPIVGGDITQQFFWKNLYGENPKSTNAKLIHEQGFYFGNSPEYTEEEIKYLLDLLIRI